MTSADGAVTRVTRWAALMWAAGESDKAVAYAEEWASVLDCAARWQRPILAMQFALGALCRVQRAQLSRLARRLGDRARVPFIKPTGSTRVTGITTNGKTTIEIIIKPARGQKLMNLGDTLTLMKNLIGERDFQLDGWMVTAADRGGIRLRRTSATPPESAFDLFQPQDQGAKPRLRGATPSTTDK